MEVCWLPLTLSFPDVLWRGRPLPLAGLGQGHTRKMLLLSLWWMWRGTGTVRNLYGDLFSLQKNWGPLKIYQENLRKAINKQSFWPLLNSWEARIESFIESNVNEEWSKLAWFNFSEINFKEITWLFTNDCDRYDINIVHIFNVL